MFCCSSVGSVITDAGLVHLRSIPGLRTLRLDDTDVTDAGLDHLKGMTTLEFLSLRETKVTDEGVKNLQQALPRCKIVH